MMIVSWPSRGWVSVELRGEAVAYPWEVLTEARVVNDQIGDLPVTIFWKGGTGSAIDSAVDS